VNLLALGVEEKLATVLPIRSFEPGHAIILVTKSGKAKKTDIMAYSRPRTGGIIALNLVPGDELIAARITDGTQNAFLGSRHGKSIRFHESNVRPMARASQGVRGMSLEEGDFIVGMEVLTDGKTLMTITENGYGKRTSIDEYPIQKDEDDMMLMTDRGKIIRMPVKDISVIGRNTQGVRLIAMAPGERVVSAARLAEKDV